MNEYIIFTDSGSDIAPAVLNEWGVKWANLTFKFDDSDKEYTNEDITSKEFYQQMRDGKTAKTSAVNAEAIKACFEPALKEGKDVLYMAFSSGLSTTYNSARLAAEELREAYPDRKIITIDTLAASAGVGLIVYFAVKNKEKGMSIEENEKYIRDLCPNISIWFTVDDLVYLKRGGRISPTAAFVGGVLGIKPILHMDENGKLVSVSKVRGRKLALKALADKYKEMGGTEQKENTVFLSHADCIDEAKEVEKQLADKYGIKVEHIADIGAVVGSHAGPGTIAMFFVGTKR